MHSTRIACKRLRYLLEPLRAPALLRDALAFASTLAPTTIPVERERKFLLTALPAEVLEKRRYCVDEGEWTWEVDEFLDRELTLAEVELEAVNQYVPIPPWLDRVMVREVTGEPAYLNLTLATEAA